MGYSNQIAQGYYNTGSTFGRGDGIGPSGNAAENRVNNASATGQNGADNTLDEIKEIGAKTEKINLVTGQVDLQKSLSAGVAKSLRDMGKAATGQG